MVRQAHHPEQGRRTDGVSPVELRSITPQGEKRHLSPLAEHGDTNPVFDIIDFNKKGNQRILYTNEKIRNPARGVLSRPVSGEEQGLVVNS